MFSIVGSLAGFVIFVLTTIGLAGLFGLMTVESFGIPPLPSEVILPFAGFLIATGVFPLIPTLVVALAGGLLGSFFAYAAGRWWRTRVTGLGFGPFRLEERHLVRVDQWFARHGEATVALARLVPVIRSYISYPAGSARMPPVRFGVYTLLGMIPFTLAFLYAGIWLGHRWDELEHFFGYLDLLFVALVAGGIAYLVVVYITRIYPTTRPAAAPPVAPPAPGEHSRDGPAGRGPDGP